MDRTALFSPCRTFRYRLGRRWSDGPVVAFIMLNPSCADEHIDDPSVRRCIGFARRLGYGGLEAVNLYAFLATDPAELRRAGYPMGSDNDQQITEAVHESSRVVAAWGVHAARLGRPKEVLGLLNSLGRHRTACASPAADIPSTRCGCPRVAICGPSRGEVGQGCATRAEFCWWAPSIRAWSP